jgi:hypothetical protein
VKFYAVFRSVIPCMSSLCDNRAGNKTGVSGTLDCCQLFRTLRTPLNHLFYPDNRIKFEKDSPSSLWVLQMVHQTKMCPDPSGRRVFFTDNFNTHHHLPTALKLMMDGEAWMIGTVRFTLVDATNWYCLEQAISNESEKEHGYWCLVRAYNEYPDFAKLQQQHQAANSKLPKTD